MGTVIRWGMGAAAIILFLSLLLSGSLLWYKYHDDCAGKKEYQLICKIAETQTAGDFSRLCFLPETSNLPVSAFTCPESRKTSVSSENRRTVPSRTEPGLCCMAVHSGYGS